MQGVIKTKCTPARKIVSSHDVSACDDYFIHLEGVGRMTLWWVSSVRYIFLLYIGVDHMIIDMLKFDIKKIGEMLEIWYEWCNCFALCHFTVVCLPVYRVAQYTVLRQSFENKCSFGPDAVTSTLVS